MTVVNAHFVLPNGVNLTSGAITFTPTGLRRAGTGSILTPDPVEVAVSTAGHANSPDLLPGGYTVKVEAAWFLDVYPIVVPDTGTVELMELIQQFTQLPEPLVSSAWEAAEAARQARDEIDTFIQHLANVLLPQITAQAEAAGTAADEAGGHARDASDAADAADGHRRDAVAAAGAAREDREAVAELRDQAIDARDVTTEARDTTLTAIEGIDDTVAHVDQAKTEVLAAAGRAEDAAELADEKADAASISAGEAKAAAEQAAGVVPPATSTELGKIKLRGDLSGTAETPTVPGLATKRDTISGVNRAYTNDGNGNPSSLPYSSGTTPSSIMFRDTAGRTKVADPAAATDAANKDYVDTEARSIATAAIAEWVDGTPAALDTLQELAAALGNDPNFATTVMNLIGQKAALVHGHTAAQITDATILGRVLMTASTQGEVLTAIGAASQVYMTALEQTLEAYFNALNLRDAGAWSPTAAYDVGQVVSYNHSRYYCREGHDPVATFPADKYVRTGADIVFATSDPGGGQAWVKI